MSGHEVRDPVIMLYYSEERGQLFTASIVSSPDDLYDHGDIVLRHWPLRGGKWIEREWRKGKETEY